ncbi:class I SAM-dependent methyltransferase [Tolypothrix sp. VBCCA 56010]|uniref:class I SAM-dependent methyltransferase n=1 Tax=Tolypothrix sp. VBCCA 56010 TaxID=3137731 RepID=UPI003D7D3290
MTKHNLNSELLSKKSVAFRERSHCISCGSSKLHPLWQGKFTSEPTRSFIEKCHYSEDVIALLKEETFSLISCDTCGMVFHQRILTPEWLNLLYSQWINDAQIERMEAEYQTDNKREILFERGRRDTKHLLRLRKLIKSNTTEQFRILDYGCGDGDFLALAKLFGFKVCGIDFSSTRHERAAKTDIPIFNNLGSLKFYDMGKIQAVTLFQVLEHLEDPLATLKQIANKMEDKGILIVEVSNCRGISQPKSFLEFHAVHPLEHINAFTPITLKKMCEQAGFVSLKRIPAHVTTSFVNTLQTEGLRFIQPNQTQQYFRLQKSS